MPAVQPLLLKLGRRDLVAREERAIFERAVARTEVIPAGTDIVAADASHPLTDCRLVVEGVASRWKSLPGSGSHAFRMDIPGDFVDLDALVLGRLDYGVTTVTQVRVLVMPHDRLNEIAQEHPHLTRLLWLNSLLDAAVDREHAISAARRSALARVAHLLCETLVRFENVGLAQTGSFPLPLAPDRLADACGLSTVHVNRALEALRSAGLVTWQLGRLTVHDVAELSRLGEFDGGYLSLRYEAP
jgi:CRP-like cAMP-binding protein